MFVLNMACNLFLKKTRINKNQFYILHLVSERGFVVPPQAVVKPPPVAEARNKCPTR